MAEWIWYPGDFELYHAMKQNFSRVERGYGWPAFWKSEGFRNRVVFKRMYVLNEETSFQVFSKAIGFCLVEAEGREKRKLKLGKIYYSQRRIWLCELRFDIVAYSYYILKKLV